MNGNDLIEFEEEHAEQLEEDFLTKNALLFIKFVNDVADHFESLGDCIKAFKDHNSGEWTKHIIEYFDNSRAD